MKNKYIRTTLIVLIWLVIWQVLALVVNNSILLSGPVETVKALIELGSTSAFKKWGKKSSIFPRKL